MNKISNIHYCYGCGVCTTVCAKQIISIDLIGDGFYEPRITDESKCTSCGLCLDVCAYSHYDLSLKVRCIKSYGAWSKDEAVRMKCSSGGVGFEFGRMLIGEGYKVCGVRYNAEANRAEHDIATTVEELIPSVGSKYIQSYTVDGFKAIDRNSFHGTVFSIILEAKQFVTYISPSNNRGSRIVDLLHTFDLSTHLLHNLKSSYEELFALPYSLSYTRKIYDEIQMNGRIFLKQDRLRIACKAV